MTSTVMFVNPPVSLRKRYSTQSRFGNRTAPLTLCHLAALTRKARYPTAVLDASILQLGLQETVARIVEEQPRYLGLYATTLTIDDAAQLGAAAKKLVRNLCVIIGGVHFTTCAEETMRRYPAFDVGVIGEGDITVIELLDAIEGGRELSEVDGIIFHGRNTLVRTRMREQVEDLNTLPMPAFDLLEGFPDFYFPPFFGFTTTPIATLVVSRGCPARCIFCSSGIFGHTNLRVHSPKYVVELMHLLEKRYGVKQLLFYDDNFGTFRKHVEELCERIIEAGLQMTWSCNTRVTDVTPELLALMKRAGCWQIYYGIESGNQRMLDFIRKGTTLEGIRRALRWTREAGIRSNGYFVFGFPTETEKEIRESIEFAKSLDLDIFQCTLFTPFPALPFSKNVEEYGSLQGSGWGEMNIFNPVFVADGLSPELLEGLKRRAWREFYFRPRTQFNILREVLVNPGMMRHYLRTVLEFLSFAVLPRSSTSKRVDGDPT